MICKNCGNTTKFTMIKEIAFWNHETKRFDDATDGDVYYVCDDCMYENEEGKHIDTEGEY